ncbi:amidase family protein [Pseudomonas sichuanensis]|uniref:amidase family protein n=1 Tax=Pseudomonas sichuanensis TaxID=2213015 RepID=UPI00244B04AE|nr:amidase family protein [Pseudomonas sichuanensis]MDH0730841.1 amidase family protein [Pseudomonas sichuanensis]MDH1582034.1 amidase family protein [Pseudomonas sichuanensis]MDH1594565.1 amidase family protein [Pseudomonas sichuanensis]MDH1596593.1 amidase family protein [Pseudomonas sichuanensis]
MNNLLQKPPISVIGNYFPPNSAAQSDFDGPVFASIIEPDSNDFATIAELQALLAEAEVTSVDLVTRALARIAALNQQGPQLRAVIETNPDALTIAEALDAERASGELRGRLHGIPVLIKDNIDSGDSMQTSAGSLALVGEPAPADAYLVQRLRAAGAIILGKANTSEWMGFRDWMTPMGWSGRGGQTQSALGEELAVFGSSAGSAVAVSAGFVAAAVGTETNGSLVGPAFFSQVVGLRPTLGLLSASGLVPLTSRQDTAGPMARTVTDAATLLDAMFGLDMPTPAPEGAPTEMIDYTGGLDATALEGARLGYPSLTPSGTPMLEDPVFAAVAPRLENAGATLVPIDFVFPDLFQAQMAVISFDLKRELAQYLGKRTGIEVRTLADVIAFNETNPVPEEYGQALLVGAEALEFDEELYTSLANQLRNQSQALIDDALVEHELTALVDLPMGRLVGYGAQAGYPGLTVPAGIDDTGMLKALHFSGSRWSDQTLLSLGHAFEQSEA